MKIIKYISCVTLVLMMVLLQTTLFAQHKATYLTITPVFLNFAAFTIQPGFEYHYNQKWSLTGELCFASPSEQKTGFEKVDLFRSSLELKRFVKPRKRHTYFSLQTSYLSRTLISNHGGAYYSGEWSDTAYRYGSAIIHSPILAMAVKTGYERMIGRKFVFDLFIGFGSRTSFTRYEARNVTKQERFFPRDKFVPLPEPSYMINSILTRFHMPIGFRLGFLL